MWLVAWDPAPDPDVLQDWLDRLSLPEVERLATIGPHRGRVRFAASHAALAALTGGGRHTSLAHTDRLAAVASSDSPVGVDVEPDFPRRHWRRVDALLR